MQKVIKIDEIQAYLSIIPNQYYYIFKAVQKTDIF